MEQITEVINISATTYNRLNPHFIVAISTVHRII